MQSIMQRVIDRLINTASDILLARWPGRKLRKIDGDIARLERIIGKEIMMRNPNQDCIDEYNTMLNKRKLDRARLIYKK